MWGKTFYSTDINELMAAKSMGIKTIVIDDDAPEFKRLGCVVLSILLPPFEAIDAELNGNIPASVSIYTQYLTSDIVCTQAFGAICTALYKGKDILFFISPDQAKNLNYGTILMNFMHDVFGITAGSLMYPESGILNNQIENIINRFSVMYLMGFIPFELFCMEFPINANPNIDCCYKMISDLQLNPNQFNSQNDMIMFCKRYMNQSIHAFENSKKNKLNPCPIFFDEGD